jgi:integrase/recombinase XerD
LNPLAQFRDVSIQIIKLSPLQNQGLTYIQVNFRMQRPSTDIAKTLKYKILDKNVPCLKIPNSPLHLKDVFSKFKGLAWIDSKALFNNRREKISRTHSKKKHETSLQPKINRKQYKLRCAEAYRNHLKRLNYSEQTIRSYTS